MSEQEVTSELCQWILEQDKAGRTPIDIWKSMVDSGWAVDVALAALELMLPGRCQGLDSVVMKVGVAGVPVPAPNLSDSPVLLTLDGHVVSVLMALRDPSVVVFGGLLADEECDELVALARLRLARSETIVTATGSSEVSAARTSEGMFFGRGENDLCTRIEARIGELLRWPVEYGEGLQILCYPPGAEYKPHYDYFDPAQPGTPVILKRGGQRVGTLLIYLSSPKRGGCTTFPHAGLEVTPIKGNAVFFSYDRPHPTTLTLHGGAPVLEGEKWVATKWFREGRFE